MFRIDLSYEVFYNAGNMQGRERSVLTRIEAWRAKHRQDTWREATSSIKELLPSGELWIQVGPTLRDVIVNDVNNQAPGDLVQRVKGLIRCSNSE